MGMANIPGITFTYIRETLKMISGKVMDNFIKMDNKSIRESGS